MFGLRDDLRHLKHFIGIPRCSFNMQEKPRMRKKGTRMKRLESEFQDKDE